MPRCTRAVEEDEPALPFEPDPPDPDTVAAIRERVHRTRLPDDRLAAVEARTIEEHAVTVTDVGPLPAATLEGGDDDGFLSADDLSRKRLHRLLTEVDIPVSLLHDLAIDPDQLDEELAVQPTRYARYALVYAEAQAELERVKQAIDVCSATVGTRVRTELAERGDKVTDAKVEALTKIDPENGDLIAEKDAAIRKSQVFDAIRHAFEQRSSMIVMLCSTRNRETEMTR